MILKLKKSKQYENPNVENEIISCGNETQFISCEDFKLMDGMIFANKECIQAEDYKQYSAIDNIFYEYLVNSVYLMNDKGETIERLK